MSNALNGNRITPKISLGLRNMDFALTRLIKIVLMATLQVNKNDYK
jgi:hypothetical protein